MSANHALSAAHDAGVHVDIDGDDLVLAASAAPPSTVVELLTRHKPGILALLRDARFGPSVRIPREPEDADAIEERVALIVANGVPSDWAAVFAVIDAAPPPPGFTLHRWRQVINDAGRFLDNWALKATALGWSVEDIFGVNPDALDRPPDSAGLILLIEGGDLTHLGADAAIIRNSDGTVLVFYKAEPMGECEPGDFLFPRRNRQK